MAFAPAAKAQNKTHAFNNQTGTAITFRVTNLENVTGFGAHLSTTCSTDGYGGREPECHFVAGKAAEANVQFLCFDGFKDPQHHANQFRVSLGPKKGLSEATIVITKRGVQIQVQRIGYSGYTKEQVGYVIESFLPLREETGFFKTNKICWRSLGVLNGRKDRPGTGYNVIGPW